MSEITFSTFTGYALPYAQLVQFCLQHQKSFPPRKHVRGPSCIVAESNLTQEEKAELARHPQVIVHQRCIIIDFDAESDEEKRLGAFGLLWCANLEDGFAYVVLPEAVEFLSQRAIA